MGTTACYYNSSVSNLCFACRDASQVFLVVTNFPPFLRRVPRLILKSEHTCREEWSLTPRQVTWGIIAPPSATTPKSCRTRIVGKRFKVNIAGTEDLFVCFIPFPAPGLTDILRSFGWQYPACRDQETDHSLSEDVPGIHRRSVPCKGGAPGFSEITTPTVQTCYKWKAFVSHFTTFLKISNFCFTI